MRINSEESLNSEFHSTAAIVTFLTDFHLYVTPNRQGMGVGELRVHIREQQREQARQKAIEAEACSAER